jgi:putative nucleotidyltransferase with HDIG domain
MAELLSNDQDVARNAFTAGLLHDIGKLALALNFEEQYQGALKLAEKQKLHASEVEAQVFGATHAETGAYLLSVWGLPLPIVEAVARHHNPARSMDKVFSATTALHLAEQLEYTEDPSRRGSRDIVLDVEYPAELQIGGRIDELKAIVRRDSLVEVPKAEKSEPQGSMVSQALEAQTAALPADGQPAPLVEVAPGRSGGQVSKKAVVTLITCVSVVLACAIAFVTKSQKAKAKEAISASEVEDAANRKNQLSNFITEASEQTPLVPVADPLAGLKLQAVMVNGARSTTIINGRSLRVGDVIEEVKILEVHPNEVVVEKAGAKHTLRLQ